MASESIKINFQIIYVCDIYHNETYPLTEALSQSDVRLARYDDINHDDMPAARRFLYIENPAGLYDENSEIRQLCQEVIEAKNNQTLENETQQTFKRILLEPYRLQNENNITPEVAFRRAAANGNATYLSWIYSEFKNDINAKDNNPNVGNTALHNAIISKSTLTNKIDCIKLLIELEADLDIPNVKGEKPRDLILSSSEIEIRNLLATNNQQSLVLT